MGRKLISGERVPITRIYSRSINEKECVHLLHFCHLTDALIQSDLQEQLGLSVLLKGTSTDFSTSLVNTREFNQIPRQSQTSVYVDRNHRLCVNAINLVQTLVDISILCTAILSIHHCVLF